jgi:hypothetical protein
MPALGFANVSYVGLRSAMVSIAEREDRKARSPIHALTLLEQ